MKKQSLLALMTLSLALAGLAQAEDCCPVNPYGSQTPIYVPSDEPNDAPVQPGGSEEPVYVPSDEPNCCPVQVPDDSDDSSTNDSDASDQK